MIELRQVWKRFGDRIALHPLDLVVRAGETVALVGPNGAGKSTALRILAGTVHASGGSARVEGNLAYLSQRLGVPQTTKVSALAALVARARGFAPTIVRDALDEAGLGDRLDAALCDLSGGQRQRIMLTLATVGDVGALLLDEPSISLDIDGAEDVRAAIAAARRRGVAVLFASHHLHDVALLAERIVLLVEGRVVAQGSLAELAAAAGVPSHGDLADPPIERIYRVLVRRSRGLGPARVA
ncbi:MAG TPA: ABC transporter ATP-binding protein [Gemmatimonadales bacterium]|nr:ABC transporter ATP-binding protein [Gemmatimonadales bacterium]